jgi:tryptophanase
MKFRTIIEPFKIKSVEPIRMSTIEERRVGLREAHYNPFLLHADEVIIDFLTDSGTSAMSAAQWAGIMEGDEAYAGSKSWLKMEAEIQSLTGMPFILPTHQGRAGERILYAHLGGKGKIFISNTHFDTTRANIEFSGAQAMDIPVKEGLDMNVEYPFKGNIDIASLENLLNEHGDKVAAVIITVTNNSGGGQPVSLSNVKEASSICRQYQVPLVLDCCRIAENSWFIHEREKAYEHLTFREIATAMFSYCDAAIMSAKKDALVNMGGFVAMRSRAWADACTNLLIITEGFSTYGGLSGRDMEAIAIGLKEVFDEDYLRYRVTSTRYLGEHLSKLGVPIMKPTGGHAVYVDARALLPHIPIDEYPGQALVCALYEIGGIRSVEVGSVMFGNYDDQHRLIPAPNDLVRLAIPRRVYTQSHIEYVIEVFEKLMEVKDQITGFEITQEPQFLRHFTAHFKPKVSLLETA